MRCSLLLVTLLFFSFQLYSQTCESDRYQKAVFSDVTITEDLVYSTADVYDALNLPIEFDFRLDVYEPTGDVLEKRPLVIMQFGGAYIFGNKHHADMRAWCDSLARYGYVAVSIDYRLGLNALSEGSAVRAMYRAIQDTRAAIRYMLEHQDTYRIDPDHIYIGGESAGAINSLHTAFMTTEAERPDASYGILFENFDLGCLDCSGNDFQHSFDIKGVIDLWGGVLDLDLISANEDIPTLIIHGEDDFIVPYDEGFPFASQFQLTFPYIYASQSIHNQMDNLGIQNEYHIYPGEGHLFYGLPDGIITFPNENWNPVWTQGHEFLYNTMGFQSAIPIGETLTVPNWNYIYQVPLNEGSEYCWNAQGGTIVSQNENEVTVRWNQGMAALSVVEKNCIDVTGEPSQTLEVNATVGLHESTALPDVQIFPNQVIAGGPIQIQTNQPQSMEISIVSVDGRVISSYSKNDTTSVPTTNLASGLYFLHIEKEGKQGVYKFIVR